MLTNLVIGNGEVGRAIAQVLNCPTVERDGEVLEARIIHICFPYSDKFVEYVKEYQEKSKAKYTVIHSTVPVGTCNILNAIHSPIRGKHPDLAPSIRIFVKYFGGSALEEVVNEFEKRGVTCYTTDKSETTEALKLWSTEQYRNQIAQMREIYHYCQEHDLPFEIVYQHSNQTYNEGYEAMGFSEFKKPILKYMGEKNGGHCIDPNHMLLYGKE